jgi:methylenetetrahydrofolate dehydrogenase (NADP+) / methenyltetrahydrofolate cyclohydrolase
MVLIDGKKASFDLKAELKTEIERCRTGTGKVPGLAMIIIGADPASQVYVSNKAKTCKEIGIVPKVLEMPHGTSLETLLSAIGELNNDNDVHGILVQHPLPEHIDGFAVTLAVDPSKDVDGFHPENLGCLVMGLLDKCFVSCTPAGILELFERYRIETEGKHCVIIGRSDIAGKPMANLMLRKHKNANCTVTVCHSATRDLEFYTRHADILVAAVGKPGFITSGMVKPGSVIIDVGNTRIEDPLSKSGYRFAGDVDFESVSSLASAITPVPGGVGPMTIAMLMKNTLLSFKRFNGLP